MNFGSLHQLTSDIFHIGLPLSPDSEKGWKPYHLFRGWTKGVSYLSCHASALSSRHCPHPPHAHKEEEILLLLSGEVELVLPDLKTKSGTPCTLLSPGQFVYYPSYFPHTLKTTSKYSANYLMLKWLKRQAGTRLPIDFGWFDTFPVVNAPYKTGFHHHLVFEGSTLYLAKLQCHASTLTPGAGYAPHRDRYDVAIIVLTGEVETLGRKAGPNSVIFYPAGEPHGIKNPGSDIAKYLVFEFHSHSHVPLLSDLTDLQCWKREIKHLFDRVAKIFRETRQ